MKLTKFGHSCVRLDEDGRAVVIDPGVFSDVPAAAAGAQAFLITHEHPDHVDMDAVAAAARADDALQIFAPAAAAAKLSEFGERVTTTHAGSPFEVAGFEVETIGGQHALIHPLIPVVANVGYIVNGTVYHPGDALIVSPKAVPTVLVPIHAPWSRVAEVIDFVNASSSERAFQIHDGFLNDAGITTVEGLVQRIGHQYGTAFRHLAVGESVTL